MTMCGCGCCALIMLGQDVEKKRGLKQHDGCWHCIQATFDGCTCHSCRVVNECKVYAKDGAVGAAPTGTEMTRQTSIWIICDHEGALYHVIFSYLCGKDWVVIVRDGVETKESSCLIT